MKVTYTKEAVADIVEAITYLNERNPTAAANLDAARSPGYDRVLLCEVGRQKGVVRRHVGRWAGDEHGARAVNTPVTVPSSLPN